jgi:hypothetical protein
MVTDVCEKLCAFYKPGKNEELKCGTFLFLERNLTGREVREAAREAEGERLDLSRDESIRSMVCEKCDFLADGCDFRQGLDSPPCGGYTVIEHLLRVTDRVKDPS